MSSSKLSLTALASSCMVLLHLLSNTVLGYIRLVEWQNCYGGIFLDVSSMNFSKCQIIFWLHHGLHEHKDIFKVCSFFVFIEFHLNELLNNSCLFIFTHCKDNYHDLAAFYEEKKELQKYHTGQFGK